MTNFMVYFKGPKNKHFRPMSLATGELFGRLVYAPMYKPELFPVVVEWIEHNKQCAPDCKIQIRAPGTGKILYQ